jgi:hypothetical protein
MTIPSKDSFEGLTTHYSDTELRQGIANAVAANVLGSGGGGGGGATSAKQDEQTAELVEIKGASITGATMPAGGSGAFGWLSAIWKTITDRLPSTLVSGLFQVLAEDPAPVEVSGTASANNTDLYSADVSQYKFVSVQIVGTFVGTVSFQISNDGIVWLATSLYNPAAITTFASTATAAILLAGCLNAKFFRIRTTAFTSGTINATVLLYKKPPNNISVSGSIAISGTSAVTVSSGSIAAAGSVAHDAVIGTQAPLVIGGNARTTNYTATASDDVARLVCTTVGAQIVFPFAIPELSWQATTAAITGTADTLLVAAAGASVRNYLNFLAIINTSATATVVQVKDGTTVIASFFAPSNTPIIVSLGLTFLRSTANAALNVACVTTGTNTIVTGAGFRAP